MAGTRFEYDVFWKNLRAEVDRKLDGMTPAARGDNLLILEREMEREYILCALGNALAAHKKWSLLGMDAIEYAIILKFSWLPEDVRSLSLSDKWLVLHEELRYLKLANETVPHLTDALACEEESLPSAILEIWQEHREYFALTGRS